MTRHYRKLLNAGMIVFAFSWCTTWANAQFKSSPSVVLLEDDFSNMPTGALSRVVGAHTEHHFLPEAAPMGHQYVSLGHWFAACVESVSG